MTGLAWRDGRRRAAPRPGRHAARGGAVADRRRWRGPAPRPHREPADRGLRAVPAQLRAAAAAAGPGRTAAGGCSARCWPWCSPTPVATRPASSSAGTRWPRRSARARPGRASPARSARPPIGSALLLYFLLDIPVYWGLLFGAVISVVAVVGDLGRVDAQARPRVKDMSNLLPGHGGVMDRLDSILFAVPTAYLLFAVIAANQAERRLTSDAGPTRAAWETGGAMTTLPVIPTSPDQPDAVPTRRRPAMPPRHLADLDLAAPPGRGDRARRAGVPRPAALHPLLRPAGARRRRR